ncbi:uncharacterized [Tachysurus ichikawai]
MVPIQHQGQRQYCISWAEFGQHKQHQSGAPLSLLTLSEKRAKCGWEARQGPRTLEILKDQILWQGWQSVPPVPADSPSEACTSAPNPAFGCVGIDTCP